MFFFLSSFRWRLKTDSVSGWTCNKLVDSNSSSRRRSDRQREKKRKSLEERYLLIQSLTVSFFNETFPLLTCGLNVMITLLVKRLEKKRNTIRFYLKEVFSFSVKHHGIMCCVTARLERMPRVLNPSSVRASSFRCLRSLLKMTESNK